MRAVGCLISAWQRDGFQSPRILKSFLEPIILSLDYVTVIRIMLDAQVALA